MRAMLVEVAAQVRRDADGATWFELASATARAHRDMAGSQGGRRTGDPADRRVAAERHRLLSELLAIRTRFAGSQALRPAAPLG